MGRWTGIPVTRLQQAETERLVHMEEELHQRVIGQGRCHPSHLESHPKKPCRPEKPSASDRILHFSLDRRGLGRRNSLGRWQNFFSPDREALIRVDMSEYMEKFSVSRLIGAPPGYVGYEDSGALTKAVRRRPYSVVLLDEIEKAHPDVFNILLQVLDEGAPHGQTTVE